MNANDRDNRDEIPFDEIIQAFRNEVTSDELRELNSIVNTPELKKWRKAIFRKAALIKENANESQIWDSLVSIVAYDLEDGLARFFFDLDTRDFFVGEFQDFWIYQEHLTFPEARVVTEFFFTWLKTHSFLKL